MATKTQSKEKAGRAANRHAAVRVPAQRSPESMAEHGSEAGRHVSEAEYWEHYYHHPDFSYEWNNGVLEMKPMSDPYQSALYDWFVALLRAYLTVHPLAKRMAFEMGVRLDTKTKKREYAAAGVSEYYILDAHGVHTGFFRLNAARQYEEIEPDANGVIRSSVLPGFQFRLHDLERQPSLVQLAEDEVYQAFVLPEYQAALTRAEQERAHAEQERARADRLAAKLRELGIDVNGE